jgi:hypothetical protein
VQVKILPKIVRDWCIILPSGDEPAMPDPESYAPRPFAVKHIARHSPRNLPHPSLGYVHTLVDVVDAVRTIGHSHEKS